MIPECGCYPSLLIPTGKNNGILLDVHSMYIIPLVQKRQYSSPAPVKPRPHISHSPLLPHPPPSAPQALSARRACGVFVVRGVVVQRMRVLCHCQRCFRLGLGLWRRATCFYDGERVGSQRIGGKERKVHVAETNLKLKVWQ